jgi:hypothetical protein
MEPSSHSSVKVISERGLADQAIGYNTAYRTALGNAIASGSKHRESIDTCFEAKGYRKVSVEDSAQVTAK